MSIKMSYAAETAAGGSDAPCGCPGCRQLHPVAGSRTTAAEPALRPAISTCEHAWARQYNRHGRGRSLVLKRATVVSMDPLIGDFAEADILLEGSRIAAVARVIETDVPAVDCRGMIAFPGFVDTHRHCWQNVFRRFAPSAASAEYRQSSNAIAAVTRPQDVYAGNLLSSLGALDCGITSLLDWSHISNTPDHSDAAVEALKASGIRAIYGYGHSRCADPRSQYPEDIARLRREQFASEDQLVSLVLAADIERAHFWPLARELGIRITSHAWRQSAQVEKAGTDALLGEDVTLIHCTGMSERAWKFLADSGTSISLAASSVAQIGVGGGIPPVQTAIDHGIRPSLSIDIEVSLPGDMFTQMRVMLAFQRGLSNERRYDGDVSPPKLIGARDVLEFATVQGARANGMLSRTGTLTPGKAADLVLLKANDINVMPLNNAVGTIVSGADRGNIFGVMVDGLIRKWDHELVDVDVAALLERVSASRDWLAERAGYPTVVEGDGYGIGEIVPDPGRSDLANGR